MPDKTDRDLDTTVDISIDTDGENPAALDAYLRTIDESVTAELAPAAVGARLAQLRDAVAARSDWHEEDWDHLVERLTEYAYQVVHSWLAIIAADGSTDPALSGRDVDELADDIVTRGISGFRDELARIRWWLRGDPPDMKSLLLLECALQLPHAYRSWRLSRDGLSWEALEELAMESDAVIDDYGGVLPRLYAHIRRDRERITYLLQMIRYSEAEAIEIIEATLATFDLVAGERGPR